MTTVACPLLGNRPDTEAAAHALVERARMAIGPCTLDWTPDPPNIVFPATLSAAQTTLLATLASGAATDPTATPLVGLISVTVGGVQGPPGTVDLTAEVPAGPTDGSSATHTLSKTPQFLLLFRNGLLMQPGPQSDYTLAGNVLTFTAGNVCQPGDSLIAIVT